MTSTNDEKIEFLGLEPLLQKSFGNKDLRVTEMTSTSLLPLGENYCSIIVKIDATIRDIKDAKEEKLHLVAKMTRPSERPVLEWPLVFKKEVFIYTDLLPAYRALESKLGVEERKLINVLPKYIGHRYSLDDTSDRVDENSALVMENMKVFGYYICNRHTGMDAEHAKVALSSLARYHALGIALKRENPIFFKKAIAEAQILGAEWSQVNEALDNIYETIEELPAAAKHLKLIKSSIEGLKDAKLHLVVPSDPWATITHGDFWVNNLLFHKDQRGKVDDVRFVDFHTYLYNSPLKDLPYFLGGNLDDKTIESHFDELLDVYYESFMRALDRLGCDLRPYSRDEFEQELRRQALGNFALCAIAMKFFVYEVTEVDTDNKTAMSNVFQSKSSDVFKNKLTRLIRIYEARQWFT